MTITTAKQHLRAIGACSEAREWAGERTAQQCWDECPRADWLLWWAENTEANSNMAIAKAGCACARSVLHLVTAGEDRPRLAIDAKERWIEDPSVENAAAWAAARAAAWAAAWAAARDAEVQWQRVLLAKLVREAFAKARKNKKKGAK